MNTIDLSIIILASNEVLAFNKAITSAHNFGREIIVVLDEPVCDEIQKSAKLLGAKVFVRKLDSFSNQKQFALEKSTCEWVFFLDSDEKLGESLKQEISQKIVGHKDGYFIPRKNILFGKWVKHGDYYPDYQLKLFRKKLANFSEPVHEIVKIKSNKIGYLENNLLHYNYNDIQSVIARQNLYTELEAKRLIEKGRIFSLLYLFYKPLKEFCWRYIYKRGFLDGRHGFIVALLGAQYRFIVALKLWEKGRK